MRRLDAKSLVQAAGGYLRKHPEELVRMAKNAVSLKVGLPLVAFEYLAKALGGAKAPRDLSIEARPPGVHVAASFDLMKTPVRASSTIFVERLDLSTTHLIVEVRLLDVRLKVLDDRSETPIAALLRSGALDLSRPGDLVSYMPKRPPFLLSAEKDRIVLDLMRLPLLSAESARRIVQLLLPFVSIDAVRTADEHLDVAFRAFPEGAAEAIAQLKALAQLRRFF